MNFWGWGKLPQDRSVLVAVTWGLVRKLLFSLLPTVDFEVEVARWS